MVKVGDTIKIVYMNDEWSGKHYAGKTGVVTRIETYPWGDTAIYGTWGSLAIYENAGDVIEVVTKKRKTAGDVFYKVDIRGRHLTVIESDNPMDWTEERLSKWIEMARDYNFEIYVDENSYIAL